ncbi:MAG: 2-amino-4-hydroxy-6-hydroxymethyldihydropteridine diphosphokinase [Tatlockia sp.]|nr:2-amino-4-hydroxy-6-hydroxymethyldihydropteridine diphosphokinase [Tatlockia sp.]
MTLCYLGLGSNLGSPERQIRKALHALRLVPDSNIRKVAKFHYSKAWGRRGVPDYCNTVIALNTRLNPQSLLRFCQKIEYHQGRIRQVRWGARTLDIDILLYGSQTIKTKDLKIPHPRMYQRDFVMIPLLEIANINHLPFLE